MAAVLRLLVLTLALVSWPAAVVAADDGPPRIPLSAAGRSHPAETIARPVNVGRRELVLFVGGYRSDPADPAFFAPLAALFPDMQVGYFGLGGLRYDTTGPLAANGANLAEEVRRRARLDDPPRVHLVGHSLGGLVIDEAIREGLTARDGLSSVVAIAAPHAGSTIASTARTALALAGPAEDEARLILRVVGDTDASDAAFRDLAVRRAARAPRDVRMVQVTAFADELVFARDTHVAGAERVVASARFPRHGEIVKSSKTQRVTSAVVRGKATPSSSLEDRALDRLNHALDGPRFVVLLGVTALVLTLAWSLHQLMPWRP